MEESIRVQNEEIKDIDEESIDYSLFTKQIFFFALIVSGNYIGQIFSCSIQERLENNMILKHLLGLMTMYFFVSFIDRDNKNRKKHPLYGVIITIGLYIWFIFISRTDRIIVLYILIIIFIMYIINVHNQYYRQEKNQNMYDWTSITKIKRLYLINKILFYSAIVLTIYGFIIYLGQKKYKYNKDFDYYRFFIGVSKCKFNNLKKCESLSNTDYLKRAFNIKN